MNENCDEKLSHVILNLFGVKSSVCFT